MQLCKIRTKSGKTEVGLIRGGEVHLLHSREPLTLSRILHSESPRKMVESLVDVSQIDLPMEEVQFLPPIDEQEVWAAGVTYKRSREARERESVGAAQFYDKVYKADRPELFFKATPRRVVGPGDLVQIRQDARWSVPEPEAALIVSPAMKIVGYTIGNDMSSRDIEGENPLYLPQAKVYNGSCALGPVITMADAFLPLDQVGIHLTILRKSQPVFEGTTTLAAMARTFEDLVSWLCRDNSFPEGVILLTGTGIIPPDHFTLASGDEVRIEMTGVGRLVNVVK